MGANPSVWYCRIEWTFSDYDGPIGLADDNKVELLARDAEAGFNHCQRTIRQPHPPFVEPPTMQPLARIGSEPRASASIMPTISSVTKQFLKPFCCQDSARRAPEVALIEMNEPRETGFERGVFD